MLMANETMEGTLPVGFLGDEAHEVVRFQWLALLIEPQQEIRTNHVLRSFRVNTCMPLVPHWITRGHRRTKQTVYRPMLRGYILVREDSIDTLRRIRQPLPVHGFLRFGDCFAVATESEMERLRNQEQELAKPRSFETQWDVGELARVTDGAFMGLNVTITDLVSGTRIKVEMPFMKRAVSMFVHPEHLEKL